MGNRAECVFINGEGLLPVRGLLPVSVRSRPPLLAETRSLGRSMRRETLRMASPAASVRAAGAGSGTSGSGPSSFPHSLLTCSITFLIMSTTHVPLLEMCTAHVPLLRMCFAHVPLLENVHSSAAATMRNAVLLSLCFSGFFDFIF